MAPNVLGVWGSLATIIAAVVVADLFLVTVPTGAITSARRVLTEATRALV